MKYLLYFHFYILSQGDSTFVSQGIGTIFSRDNDSVQFYIYEIGYLKWKIEHNIHEHWDDEYNHRRIKTVHDLYIISYKDIRASVEIDNFKAIITIFTDNKPIIIQLRR